MGVDVTPATFEAEVIQRSHEVPVVVDFWAPWCGPCRVLGPVLEALEAEAGGDWQLVKINTQDHPQLAQQFGIQGIPAVKAFRNGQQIDEFVGALPKPAVAQWLEGIVPSAADEAVAQADSLRASDPAAALALYQQALADKPGHIEGLLGAAELTDDADLARALLAKLSPRLTPAQASRKSKRTLSLDAGGSAEAELAAAVAADPANHDARWDLAHALAAREAWDDAFGHLMHLVRADRGYRDDGARKAMLQIFDVVGRNQMSDRWRDELMRELTK